MKKLFPRTTDARPGFTLVELLIALTIASVLTAIALPTLKDSMRQTTLARSAALVKGAFINARAQAIRTGRPFGIVVERKRHRIGDGTADQLDFASANYATRMYYVQSPIEYRGDVNDAVCYPILIEVAAGEFVPRIFFPETSAGLLYARVDPGNVNKAAANRLIGGPIRFAVGGGEYVFEVVDAVNFNVTAGSVLNNKGVPVGRGTLVEFNHLTFGPRHAGARSAYQRGPTSGLQVFLTDGQFPTGFVPYEAQEFKLRTNPIKAPLAPVGLVGRTVIDLSISGTASNPIRFGAQEIADSTPGIAMPALAADVLMNDVIVMFSADGQLDGIYVDQRITAGSSITGFNLVRLDPATTVAFAIGYVDGIVDNIDDLYRFPEAIPGTDLSPATQGGDPAWATPGAPSNLLVSKTPNMANPDCAWVTIQPLSGAISLETVASQPRANAFMTYYGYDAASPPATQTPRNIVRARVQQSRRLSNAGAVQ